MDKKRLDCIHVECWEGCLTACKYSLEDLAAPQVKDSPAEATDPLAESEANGLHPYFVELLKTFDNPAAKAVFGVKK